MSELAEVKVFGESLPLADTQEEIDRQTWTMDCGAGCLVNVRDDPTEHVNLASDPKYASIVSKMQGILKEMNKDRMVALDFFSIGVVFCAIEFICLRQLICLFTAILRGTSTSSGTWGTIFSVDARSFHFHDAENIPNHRQQTIAMHLFSPEFVIELPCKMDMSQNYRVPKSLAQMLKLWNGEQCRIERRTMT